MAKTTPWNKIKAEYLQGVTPKELGLKYKITAKRISDKANEEKWVDEKKKISENIRESVENDIKDGSQEAVRYLRSVVSDEEEETRDRISAAKGLLDISGLKSSKQEIEANGFSVVINNKAKDVERN